MVKKLLKYAVNAFAAMIIYSPNISHGSSITVLHDDGIKGEFLNNDLKNENWVGAINRYVPKDACLFSFDMHIVKGKIIGDVTLYLNKPAVIYNLVGELKDDNTAILFPKNHYGFNSNAFIIKFIDEHRLEGKILSGRKEEGSKILKLSEEIAEFKAYK